MDGYRDLLRLPGYYASSRYPIGYGDPLYPTYTRAALDAYAGYGAPVSYPPEPVSLPQYPQFLSPRRRLNPKRRPLPQNNSKRRPAPSESLTPKKKPFKKTQKALHVDNFEPKGDLRKNGKPPRKEQQKEAEKAKSPSSTLAKETEELHKLFRTGVDNGKKIVKPVAKQAAGSPGKKVTSNGAGKKRKAEEEKKEAPSKKKNKGKKKKKFSKGKKQEAKKDEKSAEAPKVLKPEPAPLTEEEKKEMELALELQVAACKAVSEFLGIPEKIAEPEPEVEKSESAQAAGDEAQEDTPTTEAQEAPPTLESQDKREEAPKPPALTPEEEKELEEKAVTFFSKVLEENSDLRKLYLDKKDAGMFECLVCHSVDAETSKKFANLTSLVMHTSMRRQKRPEHRGYGKAICDILGWESLKPKRPAKQAKVDGEDTKEVEAEKAVVETEGKQEGTNEEKQEGTNEEKQES